jgi:hypothetical protein
LGVFEKTPFFFSTLESSPFRAFCDAPTADTLPLNMAHIGQWIESTAFSDWIKASPSLLAFPFFLVLHAWGMGVLAGANAALDLRILGFAPRVPLSAMTKFYPVMWAGFVVNAISGVVLLIGYPTKALTNPMFFLKLGCIAVGMLLMSWLRKNVVTPGDLSRVNGRRIAVISLLVWASAIVSGRLLAYTCTYLIYGVPC